MTEPQPRPLPALLDDAGIAGTHTGDVLIRRIVTDSRAAEPGSLFVAIPGTRIDGRTFIADALQNGATAIVTEGDIPGAVDANDVPIIHVPDARTATAHLAAAWYGHPARGMQLVGITGTVGKTSVLSIAEAILHASGVRVASIGSLGLRVGPDIIEESSYTVPEPLLLHRWLRRAADAGCRVVLMEVTSHALVQQRVAGLRYAAGAFTNLVPLEHAEFHASFRSYVESKARFFEYLDPEAPLAFNAEDRGVRRLVKERAVRSIACGATRTAAMRVEDVRVAPAGTHIVLNARTPTPRIGGDAVAPFRLSLDLSLLGRSNLVNVALATALAISAGASANAAAEVLPGLSAPRRRMQVLRTEPFLILDDTVGHPESVNVVFETAEQLRPRRVHVVWAVRGRRGPRINRYNAEALAIWARRIPLGRLVVTRSTDATDDYNRVSDAEYGAFLRPLRRASVSFTESAALAPAIRQVLSVAGPGELVLLLGAQGMNRGAAIVQETLG